MTQVNASYVRDVTTIEAESLISGGQLVLSELDALHTLAENRPECLDLFERGLKAYTAQHGAIVGWWRYPLGSIMQTCKPRRFGRLRRARGMLHVEWSQSELFSDEADEFLSELDQILTRSSLTLRSSDQIVIVDSICGILTHIVATASSDVARGLPITTRRQIAVDVKNLQRQFLAAAQRGSQLTYFIAMLTGVVPVFLIGTLLALVIQSADIPTFRVSNLIACTVAGSLGAVVSVMARMSVGGFRLSPTLTRPWVRVLGATRPFIGAIFGVLAYFILAGDIFPVVVRDSDTAFFIYAVVAFLAGFNERWARDMLIATGNQLGPPFAPEALPTDATESDDQLALRLDVRDSSSE